MCKKIDNKKVKHHKRTIQSKSVQLKNKILVLKMEKKLFGVHHDFLGLGPLKESNLPQN